MDTFTQIILGASVGEAVAGKKAGNLAMFYGSLAGTIPDLDVLANPMLPEIQQLIVHRSFSHSFFFAFLFAPVAGYVVSKIHKKSEANFRDWTLIFLLGIITHFLLDGFTTYGTQMLWPFSDFRVSWNSIFVIDPFYTIPFFIFTFAALFFKRTSRKRAIINYTGLCLSSLYLLLTVVNKQYINSVFEDAAANAGIKYERYISMPTPLNNFLWRAVFQNGDDFYEGYYSLFDENQNISFNHIEGNHNLVQEYEESYVLRKLKWFSDNYYTITNEDKNLYFNDIRFGAIGSWNGKKAANLFSFRLIPDKELDVVRGEGGREINSEIFNDFIRRIAGEKTTD